MPSNEIEFRVRYSETDQMQVVYHANYLVWCEMGRTELIRQLWASYADVEKAGIALAVVEAHLRYHAPARYDDRVRVRTTVGEVRSRAVRFDYLITNVETGKRLAAGHTVLVPMTRDLCVSTIPDDLRRALEAAVES